MTFLLKQDFLNRFLFLLFLFFYFAVFTVLQHCKPTLFFFFTFCVKQIEFTSNEMSYINKIAIANKKKDKRLFKKTQNNTFA